MELLGDNGHRILAEDLFQKNNRVKGPEPGIVEEDHSRINASSYQIGTHIFGLAVFFTAVIATDNKVFYFSFLQQLRSRFNAIVIIQVLPYPELSLLEVPSNKPTLLKGIVFSIGKQLTLCGFVDNVITGDNSY